MTGKLLLIAICLLPIYVETKRNYNIDIEYITPVVTDVFFVKSLNFSLTNNKAANMDLILNRNLTKFPIRASVYLLTKGKRRISLFQVDFEACQALKDTAPNKFLAVFKKELLRTSNIPNQCPFIENVVYRARNYTVNEDAFPAILPDTAWQFQLNLNMKDFSTGFIRISGRVRSTG
uniref:ML domain protein n=1 Tax=Musca domestica TaxID=7370 RepID=A0A1I8NKH3_MUSDO